MRFIAEEQDTIEWTNFAESGVTKQIRDMQMMYVDNLDATYTVDQWMRDFVHKLIGLSHKIWLARSLMKHHKTKGMIANKTKEKLLKEADKISQQCLLNIEEEYSWLLDVGSAAYAEMGYMEV